MRLIVVIVVLVAATTTAHTCNKQWIKLMVMNVCSYSKRHISANEFSYAQWTMQEIDNEFKRIYGDVDDGDESLWKIGRSKESTERKEQEKDEKKRMKRYTVLNDGYFNLDLLERFLKGYDTLEEQRLAKKKKMKRNLREKIEKCCQQVCTVDDLRGICE